ncbi:MAG: VanW family protein [Clostridiales bacterium]|jgi:vancomycin resistance protein YoaR|nr:VanW family protein [Clostridiales bacterium]
MLFKYFVIALQILAALFAPPARFLERALKNAGTSAYVSERFSKYTNAKTVSYTLTENADAAYITGLLKRRTNIDIVSDDSAEETGRLTYASYERAPIADCLGAVGGGYPFSAPMRVSYYGESGGLLKRSAYYCNYRGITRAEGMKIMRHFETRGLGAVDATAEIFNGFKGDIEKFRREFCFPAKNAEVIFRSAKEGMSRFEYVEGEYGAAIDERAAAAALLDGIKTNDAEITLKILKIPPTLTAAKLREITKRRAGFSTGYGNSKPERKFNIELAAKYIDGTVIPAGGVFSFNETVGKRTADRGFKRAPVIFDGQLIEDIGGGVCQVSTTLYNAALYADLEILHAKRHSSMVGYVRPSFDAMVSEFNDLTIGNNTGCPLYVCAYADGARLKIEFFGKPMDRGVEIRLRSEVREVIKHTDSVIINDGSHEIPESGALRLSNGANGCVSEGYADYYSGGALVRSQKIRGDIYKPMNGIIVKNASSSEAF